MLTASRAISALSHKTHSHRQHATISSEPRVKIKIMSSPLTYAKDFMGPNGDICCLASAQIWGLQSGFSSRKNRV